VLCAFLNRQFVACQLVKQLAKASIVACDIVAKSMLIVKILVYTNTHEKELNYQMFTYGMTKRDFKNKK